MEPWYCGLDLKRTCGGGGMVEGKGVRKLDVRIREGAEIFLRTRGLDGMNFQN